MTEAGEYILNKKAGKPLDPHIQSVIQKLKDNLRGRDHLFFIDTSETMAGHRRDVIKSLPIYAYIAKLIDTNGIDAGFSTNPEPQRYKTTKALMDALDKQRWTAVAFESSFGNFIDSVIKNLASRLPVRGLKKVKPQSIFVLTDGRWGRSTSGACGVDWPIKRLIDAMKDKKLDRTHVMIQFIRYGDDEQGIRRLEHLDNFGGDGGTDIVDHKPWDYDLGDMFFGAINSDVDRDGEKRRPAESGSMARNSSASSSSRSERHRNGQYPPLSYGEVKF